MVRSLGQCAPPWHIAKPVIHFHRSTISCFLGFIINEKTDKIEKITIFFRLAMAIDIEGYCHFSAKTPSIGVGRR